MKKGLTLTKLDIYEDLENQNMDIEIDENNDLVQKKTMNMIQKKTMSNIPNKKN